MSIVSADNVSVDVISTMVEMDFDGAREGFRTAPGDNALWEVFTHQANASGLDTVLMDWFEEVGAMEAWDSEKQFQDMIERQYKVGHEPFHAGVKMRREEMVRRVKANGVEALSGSITNKLAYRAATHDIVKILDQIKTPTKLGYDGKALFAGDHPDGGGQSNQDTGGSASYFYVLALGGLGRPLVRVDGEVDGGGFNIKSHVGETEANFMKRMLYWSVEGWFGYAPGMWQTIYRSDQTLNEDNLDAVVQAQSALKDYHGEEMGIVGTHLLVGRSNLLAGRKLLEMTTIKEDAASGDGAAAPQNVNQGRMKLLYSPRLP